MYVLEIRLLARRDFKFYSGEILWADGLRDTRNNEHPSMMSTHKEPLVAQLQMKILIIMIIC